MFPHPTQQASTGLSVWFLWVGGEYTAVLYYCLNLLLAGLTLSQPVNSCKGERQNLQRLKESAVFGTAAAFGAVSHQYNNW